MGTLVSTTSWPLDGTTRLTSPTQHTIIWTWSAGTKVLQLLSLFRALLSWVCHTTYFNQNYGTWTFLTLLLQNYLFTDLLWSLNMLTQYDILGFSFSYFVVCWDVDHLVRPTSTPELYQLPRLEKGHEVSRPWRHGLMKHLCIAPYYQSILFFTL